jgi:hypothetical protein
LPGSEFFDKAGFSLLKINSFYPIPTLSGIGRRIVLRGNRTGFKGC